MKRTFAISILIGTLAAAQEPPILIRMIREPMRAQATERASNYLGFRVGTPILATTATTGTPETVFFEIHESYASLEAVDAVSHLGKLPERSAPYSTLLLHLPGLSFRPDLAAKLLPRARYLQISTYRIRPGTGAEFGELMRIRRAAYDAINLGQAGDGLSGGVGRELGNLRNDCALNIAQDARQWFRPEPSLCGRNGRYWAKSTKDRWGD